MHHRTTRGSSLQRLAGLLFAGLGCLVALPAQRAPERVVPEPVDFETGQDDNLFSLRRSQEDIHDFELGLAELRNGEHRAAVERLHRLIQHDAGGVVPVARGHFIGLRLAVVLAMANMSPAAKAAYADLVAREAGNLAERPLVSLEPQQLELLATRFPAAELGRAARVRLGDLALEAGDGITATGHFRRALDAAPIGSSEEQRLVARLAAAEVLVQPAAARARAGEQRLPPVASEVLSVLPETADSPTWSAIGGGHDGRTPMAELAGHPRQPWFEEIEATGFRRRESALYAMFPVGDLDGIYIATGRELIAFDPLRRSIARLTPAPLREGGGRDQREYEDQINPDMVLAAACGGDTVVAALQVPENSVNVDFNGGYRILSKIPLRRLFAFSRSTGNLRWAHFDALEGPVTRRYRGHDSCGPPLVLGDTVYAPIHDRSGAIAFAIAAYDLATGRPRWRRLVCSSQQDVNMFGNARVEFAASPLAESQGVLYGASNLGVTYALDVATGDVRWIRAYDVVQMPQSALHNQQDRIVYFANNPPVVTDGVVCMTPLDSQFALGLDAETGRELWRLPADAPVDGTSNHVRWLAGAFDDEFVLTGYGAVAVKARPLAAAGQKASVRELVPPERLRDRGDGRLAARPAMTRDRIWFARVEQVVGFDRDGTPVPPGDQVTLPRSLPGNLLLVDGILVSLRQQSLNIALDAEALRDRIEERLAATPDEPAAILRLATLRSALLPPSAVASVRNEVRALYRRGLDACIRRGYAPHHPVREALQRELFAQAIAAAEIAVRRGDPSARAALVEARETAPDQRGWVQEQLQLLEFLNGDAAARRTELDRLEREAPTASVPIGDGMPVRAYVAWQIAESPGQEPAAVVAAWQRLVEDYPDVRLGDRSAAAAGQEAIAALVQAHGPAVYAAVAERAAKVLQAAGNDPAALRAVSARFPNSEAAGAARLRLLDDSVAKGDLAMACEILLHGQRGGTPPPGLLRRLATAAVARGNRPLAAAMAERLTAFAGTKSDWPDDHGADYATVAAALRTELTTPTSTVPLAVPDQELARIRPASPRDSYVLVPVIAAEGFQRPANEPLFAQTKEDLCAIDVHAEGPNKPVLYATQVQYAEHVIVCGTTLIVPDLNRLFAVDLRTGAARWELPNPDRRMFDDLGIRSGVLHVVAQSGSADGGAELFGIEPLTGTVLFVRPLVGETPHLLPKAAAGELLVIATTGEGDLVIDRLDPISGQCRVTTKLAGTTLRAQVPIEADRLAARTFPQDLCADRERVYVPFENVGDDEAPRLLAIATDGSLAWTWRGTPGARLPMVGLRGDRLVVIESQERAAGRFVLLNAADSKELRTVPLGAQALPLNWQRSTLDNPAPAIVAIGDAGVPVAPARRLLCVPLDEAANAFEVPLSAEDGQIEPQPLFGPDFVAFGARPLRHSAYRLYALRLDGRTGALANREKVQRLRLTRTSGMAAVGSYTVVASAECLLLLGTEQPK